MGTILTNSWRVAALVGVAALTATACGDDGSEGASGGGGDQPRVVATTTILGDIAGEVVGEEAEVETLMPPGADPHEFSMSSREMQELMDADLLVVNGLDFEEGLLEIIEQAEESGVEVFVFADHVSVLETDDAGHEDEGHEDEEDGHEDEGHEDEEDGHDDEDHEDDDHEDDDGEAHDEEDADHDDHGPEDPHIWTDPTRMASGVEALGDAVAELDGVDGDAVTGQAEDYVSELVDLDAEIEEMLAPVPDDGRVLVTNHEVLGYFADRYDFEVVGTVIPSSSTMAETSSGELEELADTIEDYGLPAIFAEPSEDSGRADTVADEVGDVEVVELYSETLGEEGSGADTYVGMMRTNADRIAEALG